MFNTVHLWKWGRSKFVYHLLQSLSLSLFLLLCLHDMHTEQCSSHQQELTWEIQWQALTVMFFSTKQVGFGSSWTFLVKAEPTSCSCIINTDKQRKEHKAWFTQVIFALPKLVLQFLSVSTDCYILPLFQLPDGYDFFFFPEWSRVNGKYYSQSLFSPWDWHGLC